MSVRGVVDEDVSSQRTIMQVDEYDGFGRLTLRKVKAAAATLIRQCARETT